MKSTRKRRSSLSPVSFVEMTSKDRLLPSSRMQHFAELLSFLLALFVIVYCFRCKHYFCENCALQRYVKNTRCAVCKEQTLGIFNTATDLIKKLKQRDLVAQAAQLEQNQQLEQKEQEQ